MVSVARIRKIEIENFRGIKSLSWCPNPGLNCLIGRGDSGKSTILDAIDLCLGARRNVVFSDADFHNLNVANPIRISITLGDLYDGLKDLEKYGMFLRGFDRTTGTVVDEPGDGYETVITLVLEVSKDLEPVWRLESERANREGLEKGLPWKDRLRLAPTRIGDSGSHHFSWRRGSVISGFLGDPEAVVARLAEVAREARAAFGAVENDDVLKVLEKVAEIARGLGVRLGDKALAQLDPEAISVGTGAITLYDEAGVPLRVLGTGSSRLLLAGLQRELASRSSIVLVDEVELGLEPHRIIRFVDSLGAKEIDDPPLQVFMTTHSPTVLQELSGEQLFVVRRTVDKTNVVPVGTDDHVQGTIRRFPDAFLAPSVIVCEGATEVGLLRGLDQYRTKQGSMPMTARGVALVDSGGGTVTNAFLRASAFQKLGYRVAVLIDGDKPVDASLLETFTRDGGTFFCWRKDRATEHELFLSLSKDDVGRLLEKAISFHDRDLIDAHIRSASNNSLDLATVENLLACPGDLSTDVRQILARASAHRRNKWFKEIRYMEVIAREIVGPGLEIADPGFKSLVESIFEWVEASDV